MSHRLTRPALRILFHVKARRGQARALERFLRRDRLDSLRREPETVCFDVYRDPHDPAAFYVYEAYLNDAAFARHQQGAAYKQWKAAGFQERVVFATYDLEPLR